MNISFVRIAPFYDEARQHPQDRMWPIPTLYAATMLRERGFEAHLLDTWVNTWPIERVVDWVRDHRSDVVFIDGMTQTAQTVNDLVERIAGVLPDARIWGMGQHATSIPDQLFSGAGFDGLLMAEPEGAAIDVCEAYRAGKPIDASIPGIAFAAEGNGQFETSPARPLVAELDECPPIDHSLLDLDPYIIVSSHVRTLRKLRWGFLLTSRGCPYPCIYCSQTLRQTFGRSFRAMSPSRVVDDMERQERDCGINAIFIEDDVFTFDMDRARAICDEYIRRELRVKWVCQTRGDALDADLVDRMKRAGCAGVTFGVESGSDRVLKVLKKKETSKEMLGGARLVKKAGLALTCYYMIGNPTETKEEALETLALAKKIGSHVIQCAFFTPYPGSPFYEEVKDDIGDKLGNLSHYNSLRFNYSEIEEAELFRLQRRFYLEYLLSPRQIWRYLTHRAPYAIVNNKELGLISDSLRFFASS